MKFRPYQEKAADAITKWVNNPKTLHTAGCVVLPTGSGKSLLIAHAANIMEGGAIVLQPSVELLNQNAEKMRVMYGVSVSIFSASAGLKEIGSLTFATLGSIKNFGRELKERGVRNLIVDEVHATYPPPQWKMVTEEKKGVMVKRRRLIDSTFTAFIKELDPLRIIGFTATPFRLKTEMDNTYLCMLTSLKPRVIDEIIHVEDISTMVSGRYWTPLSYRCFDFDEGLLRTNSKGSDFTEESISEANKALNVNRNIFLEAKRLLEENKTNKILICAESVDIAKKMATYLKGAEAIYGDMPKDERTDYLNRFKTGEIRCLINVIALNIGFDEPSLTHVILGRPTKSFPMYYQQIGRVVRLHPEGLPAEVIDYCGNVKRFGRVEDLKFINHPKIGWVALLGKKVITGVKVGSDITIDKLEQLTSKGKIRYKQCAEKFTFGKQHKDKRIDKVPRFYLKWFVDEKKCDAWRTHPQLVKTVREFLEEE